MTFTPEPSWVRSKVWEHCYAQNPTRMNYIYIYTYSLVLDWTVQSSPTISGTGPDCGPKGPDHTVRSFLRSSFSSDKKTGLYGPVLLKWNWTPVQGCWTVRSSLFQQSLKKAMVRTGPWPVYLGLAANIHYTYIYRALYALWLVDHA